MPSEKFVHSMKDMCEELDQRIMKLEQFREKLQNKVNRNIQTSKNSEALARVTNSLHYAKDARRAMQSSCCDYSCEYELQDQ